MSVADISRVLGGSRIANYEDIVFQRQREMLDSELNLVQKISTEKIKDIIHQVVKLDHGFVKKSDFSNAGLNYFCMGVLSTDVNRVFVNGNLIEIRGTNNSTEYINMIILPDAPISGTRTDFVWLEVWVSDILPNKSIADGISKPTKNTIYKYGNIDFGGTNLVDEELDVSFGKETAVRSQIQYQLRSAENSADFSSPNVKAKDSIHSFSQAYDIVTGEALNGLYVAHNTMSTYGRFEVDENNIPLLYGYHYAIPICTVLRTAGETNVDLNGISDFRQSIGVSTLDPDMDYTVHGLIIQNNSGPATIYINSPVGQNSRIIFKRGGIIVGIMEAFDLSKIGITDPSGNEIISFDTAGRNIGIGTTTPLDHLHIFEENGSAYSPIYVESDNTEISLDIENKQSTTQAIVLRNTSGSTTSDYFEIKEGTQTNYSIDSDGSVSTRSGRITSLSNHLTIYPDGANELRLGYGGGGDIILYNTTNNEIGRWDDNYSNSPYFSVNVPSGVLQLGENNTSVFFGGGYSNAGSVLNPTPGLTINPDGSLFTNGMIQSVNTTGIVSSRSKTTASDGYLYLGYNGASFYSHYLKWNNSFSRFEFSDPVLISGSNPINLANLQVTNISDITNTAGGSVYTDATWTFGIKSSGGSPASFIGKKLVIKSHASEISNTHIFEVQDSSGTGVAWIDELGDMTVHDLHVTGVETVGTVSTIDTTSIQTNTLTVYDNTTLGNSASDVVLVTGTLKAQSASDSKLNLLVDNTTGTVMVNTTTAYSAGSNKMYLTVNGGIGSLYSGDSDNNIPKIWVGSDFGNSVALHGGLSWDISNNWLVIDNTIATGVNGLIQVHASKLSINTNKSLNIDDRFDVEGNIALSNSETTSNELILKFRNFNGGVNNSETRFRYENPTTNRLFLEKYSASLPNVTFDMANSRVGLQNATPLYQLDINTPTVVSTDTYATLQLQSDNYGYVLQGGLKQSSGGTLIFNTNSAGVITERIRFDSGGNVGINTVPSYTFHVLRDTITYVSKIHNTNAVTPYGLLIESAGTGGNGLDVISTAGTLLSVHNDGVLQLGYGNTLNISSSAGSIGVGTSVSSTARINSKSMLSKYGLRVERSSNTDTLGGIFEESDGDGSFWLTNVGGTSTVNLMSGGSSYFTGGNLGIGVTNPSKKLTILSSTQADGLLIRESDNGNDAITAYGYNAGGVLSVYQGGTTIFYVDGTGSTAYYTGGNLGIGTTNPVMRMDVTSNSNAEALLIRGRSSDNISELHFGLNNGSYNVASSFKIQARPNSGYLSIQSNTTDVLSITTSKVGIGTTNPTYNLSVRGDTTRSYTLISGVGTTSYAGVILSEDDAGTLNAGLIRYGSAFSNASFRNALDITTTNNGNILFRPHGTGKVGIGCFIPNYQLEMMNTGNTNQNFIKVKDSDGNNQFAVYSDASGNVLQALMDTSGNNKVVFNTAGDSYFNGGNVGIGTANPQELFHIYTASSNPRLRFDHANTAVVSGENMGEIQFYNRDADGAHISSYIRAIAKETYGRLGTLEFGVTTSLSTNATTRMVLDENGRVGINQTSPGAMLHVKDTVNTGTYQLKLSDASTSTSNVYLGNFSNTLYLSCGGAYAGGWFGDTATTAIGQIQINSGNADSSIAFSTTTTNNAGPTTRMLIDKNGYVGVGTDIPQTILHVRSNSSGLLLESTNQSPYALTIQNRTVATDLSKAFKMFQYDTGVFEIKNNGVVTLALGTTGVLTAYQGINCNNTLAMGTNNITMTGSIASSGSRATKGWFADLDTNLLQVDNLNFNVNTISSTAGGITITPLTGNNLDVSLGGAANFAVSLGSGDFYINSPLFYVDSSAGAIGIGSATPQYKLEVAGTTNVQNFLTASSPIVTNNNSNCIGVGTSSPSERITLLNVGTGSRKAIVSQTWDSQTTYVNSIISSRTNNSTYGSFTSTTTGQDLFQIQVQGSASSLFVDAGYIRFTQSGSSTVNGIRTDIDFWLSSASAMNRIMTINYNGYVGIGTNSNYNGKLSIQGGDGLSGLDISNASNATKAQLGYNNTLNGGGGYLSLRDGTNFTNISCNAYSTWSNPLTQIGIGTSSQYMFPHSVFIVKNSNDNHNVRIWQQNQTVSPASASLDFNIYSTDGYSAYLRQRGYGGWPGMYEGGLYARTLEMYAEGRILIKSTDDNIQLNNKTTINDTLTLAGEEQVTNGLFNDVAYPPVSPPTGWTASGITATQSGGVMTIVGAGTVKQTIFSINSGKKYRFKCTSNATINVLVGSTNGGSDYYNYTGTTTTTHNKVFITTSTSIYITFVYSGSAVTIDNVSLVECKDLDCNDINAGKITLAQPFMIPTQIGVLYQGDDEESNISVNVGATSATLVGSETNYIGDFNGFMYMMIEVPAVNDADSSSGYVSCKIYASNGTTLITTLTQRQQAIFNRTLYVTLPIPINKTYQYAFSSGSKSGNTVGSNTYMTKFVMG